MGKQILKLHLIIKEICEEQPHQMKGRSISRHLQAFGYDQTNFMFYSCNSIFITIGKQKCEEKHFLLK